MWFFRLAGLGLSLLAMGAWFVPPWVWGLPFWVNLVWLYVGGLWSIWGLWRDRKYRVGWAALGGLWLLQAAFIWKVWPRRPESGAFRVATFNMDAAHYSRAQIERLADSLRAWHPHLLCLQEVYLGDYRVEAFIRRLGYRYGAFLDAGGQMGMLVVSDWPLRARPRLLLQKGSTSGLQEVQVLTPQGPLTLLNVHFPSYRLLQSSFWRWTWLRGVWEAHRRFEEVLFARVDQVKSPLLVCGDFNSLPFSPRYVALSRRLKEGFWAAAWGAGPTWRYPWLRIDYIWASGKAQSYQVRWLPYQQHAYVECAYRWEDLMVPQKALPLSAQGR
ncbi:MAG: hypothetical protein D6750_04550 [Bacteroidetes bacterium]|nr:MAG: hypothetical protein D6750_04550 [Bacteroidota bacterium]